MTRRKRFRMGSSDRLRAPGAAFLLSQLGFQSSRLWRERLDALGLDPREVAVLRYVASSEGQSQRAIGNAMRVPASRMVALVDALERRTLIERRPRTGDRRAFALFPTREGRQLLGKITEVSARHEAELCAGLTPVERRRLIALLSLQSDNPRFSRRSRPCKDAEASRSPMATNAPASAGRSVLSGTALHPAVNVLWRRLFDAYARFSAGERTPRERLSGRSAHDATARPAKTSGATMWLTSSPPTARDAAAPVMLKKIPAYAHSLRRGSRGASKAIPASTSQIPRILAKYTG